MNEPGTMTWPIMFWLVLGWNLIGLGLFFVLEMIFVALAGRPLK